MCVHEGRHEKQIENTSVHTISQPTLLGDHQSAPELSTQYFTQILSPGGASIWPCTAGRISKIEGVSSPPFGTIFFPEATCGHRAGRRGRRLLREKRGLLDWFITKVAPSGNRFAEAGEASRQSLYAKTQARQESNKHAYMYSIKGHLYRSRRTDCSVIPLLRG